jgi:hypothetical protein
MQWLGECTGLALCLLGPSSHGVTHGEAEAHWVEGTCLVPFL